MTAVPFDTLKLARALRAASFTPEQAEGAATAIAEAAQTDLATKADIGEVKAEIREVKAEIRESVTSLRAEIRETEARLRTEIRDLKVDMLKWIIGTIGVQTIATIGAVIALIRFARP